jgi:PAS domain S-box-containing protein
MLEFLANLFRSDFLPHGVCYRWKSDIVWLHVTSDLLIALAYYFIPFSLIYIVRKRKDLVYAWMFWLFGIFILACGTTHLMNIWVIWNPVYRLDGFVKLVTAIASVPTAILLIRLAPMVIAIPSPEQLRITNRTLEHEIAERKSAEAEIRRLNTELEKRVEERTQELQEANKLLRESEARLQEVLDGAPTLVYMKDLDGRYLFINRRFERVFNVTRDGVRGRTDYDIFPGPIADSFRENDRKVTGDREPIEVEEVAILGGEKRTYMSVKFPLFDSSRVSYALCGISTDITERKNAEQALRRYNAELEQFAFIAAHDLQEPLRTVKNYAQLLAKRYSGALGQDGHEFLGFIISGMDRMNLLVADLQTYAEVANRREPAHVACDLKIILSETLRQLEVSITETQAKIIHGDLPTVVANPRQMGQVFQNLISNAIKYRRAADPPRIVIESSLQAGEWIIRVADNGIGLEMKYARQIFGVFKRLHGRDVPGTGIGLAICERIVEQHNGRIWVESAPGKGSTFSFSLPA